MGCNCAKNRGTQPKTTAKQYEVIENGSRVFGPTPYETTAKAVASRVAGRTVREIGGK